MQLAINLICGNLRSLLFLIQRTQKIMTSFNYHASNLLLIALKTRWLLVKIQLKLKEKLRKFKMDLGQKYQQVHIF